MEEDVCQEVFSCVARKAVQLDERLGIKENAARMRGNRAVDLIGGLVIDRDRGRSYLS